MRGDGEDTAPNPNRAQKCLLVLCGLPAAGKTTLARAIAQHAASLRPSGVQEGPDVAHICFDEFVDQQLTSVPFDPAAWKAGRRRAISQLAAALAPEAQGFAYERLCATRPGDGQMPKQGVLVIADDNMHLSSMRRQARRLAAQQKAAFLLLYLRCTPEVARLRNAARPPEARVPDAVLLRMCQTFEEPSAAEAAQQLAPVDMQIVSGEPSALAAGLWRQITSAWGLPHMMPLPQGDVEQQEAARAATAASATHQLDVRSRGVLAAALAHCPASLAPAQKAQLAAALNARRRSMMDRYRAGQGAVAGVELSLRAFAAAADETMIDLAMTSLTVA